MEMLTDPVGWWIDPFLSNAFMQRALVAGLLAVVSTAVVGTWVVLRGMSFLGDAIAHGVLPGIAIAFVLGFSTTLGALAAAMVMMLGITAIRASSPFPDDTSIGVLFAGFLALAVVIMSQASGSFAGDLTRFLFGSVTGVDDADLWRQFVVAVIVVATSIALYRAFLVLTFDEDKAQLLGLRPRLAHFCLLILIAFSIAASFEAVGNLLVFAFLIAAPATAMLLVRGLPQIMLTAVAVGAASVVLGLLVSFHHDTAASATMALVAVTFFVLVVVARRAAELVGRLQRRTSGRGTSGPA